jgi:membrane protein DedA with SNARE-associated domain
MEAFFQNLVHTTVEFIKFHQEWAFPVIFLVSFGESFVGFSLLFPGTTILMLAGTLVAWPFNPHGVLSVWPVLAGAILGAVIGDTISYMLGQRFGHLLEKHWFFIRHPELLARGYKFFAKYGTASVFVGRFFGPVRAVIPLVAGIMGMPTRRFWIANITSAFIWAPALMLVGSIIRQLASLVTAKHERLVISVVAVVVLMVAVWAWEKYEIWDRIKAARAR